MRTWSIEMPDALALPAAVFVALFAAAGPAGAADCAGERTQTGMNMCAVRNREAADTALNAAYGALAHGPTMASRLDKLRAAERAWVAFRDAECGFEGSSYEGGSMQPMVIESCAEALTKRRTAELKKALACSMDQAQC